MSEKITFKELIESIAEETDNSRQYTQGFVKNFVEIINDGLEEDGKVNIAGFGKFNLKQVDEREGFNPQTEEKITIPAHNKIIFKPYKNVRELVNAPYAHLEPELLKDDAEDEDEGEKNQQVFEEESSDPTDSGQSDFIPTAPPTSETQHRESTENLSDLEKGTEDEDEDIVEFKPENADKDENIDDELNNFFGGSEESDDEKSSAEGEEDKQEEAKKENELIEETIFQSEELTGESEEPLDSVEEDKKKEASDTPSAPSQNKKTKKTSSSTLVAVAAVVILLLTAGGIWYFSTLTDENQPEMITRESISPSENVSATTDEQSSSDDEQSNNEQQAEPDQQQTEDQTQNQNTVSSASSQNSTTGSSESKSKGVEVEQGQTLWSLAEETYGNPRLWPWIYGSNDSMEDPNLIYAGSSVSVPLPSGPNDDLTSADSVGVAKGFIATYKWYKDQNSSKAKDHLWGAKVYHDDIRSIANIEIDKADLKYANRAR